MRRVSLLTVVGQPSDPPNRIALVAERIDQGNPHRPLQDSENYRVELISQSAELLSLERLRLRNSCVALTDLSAQQRRRVQLEIDGASDALPLAR